MNKREWIDPPNFTLDTEFGPVNCTVTDAGHIYADANANGAALVYRGKRYPMTFHFGVYDEGLELYRDQRGSTLHAVYGDAPPSYKAKMIDGVMQALDKHLNANQRLLTEAEFAAKNNSLRNVEAELNEVEAKRTELIERAGDLRRAMSKLEVVLARRK